MRKITILILFPFLITACNLSGIIPGPTPTPTADTSSQQCYYNWATEPLDDVSAQVQAAIDAAGLKGVTARAEAYGENCYNSETDAVVSFSAMETDFRLSVRVEDLMDREKLGNLLEQILVVLDNFPAGATPGPQPGYVGILFQAGSEELNLWFPIADGESARARDLRGAALLDELTNK